MKFSDDELVFILRAAIEPWWSDPGSVEFSKPSRDRLAARVKSTLHKRGINAADRIRSGRS